MEKLKLPKSLLELPAKDRDDILSVVRHATTLPKTKTFSTSHAGDEHNIWVRNGDPLLGEAEDDFYHEMLDAEAENMAELFVALGLPTEGLDIHKALEPEYFIFEDELIKAKDSGRNFMSQWIDRVKKKAKKTILKWSQDGKALTKEQVKHIDQVLSSKLPNYAKKAEDYMIRAGFIGKIRNKADRENMEVLGAYLDYIPSSIDLSDTHSPALVLPKKKPSIKDPKKVYIEPLSKRELEAVKHASNHAGDKITEISEKHRAGVRQLVIQAKRERWSAQQLASKLFDKFGEHNRDWRRVAITELAFAHNDAFLAGVEEGEQVYSPSSPTACKHCKNLVEGRMFTVTHKPLPEKMTYSFEMNHVWVGKSNYGRKVSEWIPALPLHPNCRHKWHVVSRFYKMVNGELKLKDTAELIQEERAKRGLAPDPNITPKSLEELSRQAIARLNGEQ